MTDPVLILAQRIVDLIRDSGFDHRTACAAVDAARGVLDVDFLEKVIGPVPEAEQSAAPDTT